MHRVFHLIGTDAYQGYRNWMSRWILAVGLVTLAAWCTLFWLWNDPMLQPHCSVTATCSSRQPRMLNSLFVSWLWVAHKLHVLPSSGEWSVVFIPAPFSVSLSQWSSYFHSTVLLHLWHWQNGGAHASVPGTAVTRWLVDRCLCMHVSCVVLTSMMRMSMSHEHTWMINLSVWSSVSHGVPVQAAMMRRSVPGRRSGARPAWHTQSRSGRRDMSLLPQRLHRITQQLLHVLSPLLSFFIWPATHNSSLVLPALLSCHY